MKLFIVSLFLIATPAFAGDIYYVHPNNYAYGAMHDLSIELDATRKGRTDYIDEQNKTRLPLYSPEDQKWCQNMLNELNENILETERVIENNLAETVENHHFDRME